jgi:uncharacterized membrane protein
VNNIKLSKLWDSLHSSYWFVPALMALGAVALAFGFLNLDRVLQSGWIDRLSWIYTGGPEGARALLSTVAGSMITVTGTIFSITIIALQLASSNFGPRLLRNFMQDTGNQVVLGTFVATFIYCLVVLRTIRGEDNELFIPKLSVTFGLLLAVVSIGVLIYFFHHASTVIQVSHVIQQVSHDLNKAIDRLFPEPVGQSLPQFQPIGEIPLNFDAESAPVPSTHTGYLQLIDEKQLLKLATQHNLLIRLSVRPGQFVVEGGEIVRSWPAKSVNPALVEQLNHTFIFGGERTEQQDVEFPINQLVEIGIRAISPAVNDPFTALRCIDYLTAGLCRLAEREFPSPYRYDKEKVLRVIAYSYRFSDLVDAAFNQIRQYGKSDVAVILRLLGAIATIADRTQGEPDRSTLLRHAIMIKRASLEVVTEACDATDIETAYQAAAHALKPE